MIHEFLSSESWLSPQIDYLVWVQNLRINCGGLFDNCFLHITSLGEIFLPTVVICLVYWCISSNAGLYLFTLNSLGLIVGNLLKITACVYRPWILSDKVKPIDSAIKMAGGYSFPSGHCAMASTSWGGFAFLLRKNIWACSAIILLILLIAFSRNYCGVHTPQDVIVSLLMGIILIFAVYYILKYCEKNKNGDLKFLTIFNILALLSIVYVFVKHYPMDYIDGKLLVDPINAKYLYVLHIGWTMGMINGVFLCKRFFPFDAKKGTLKEKIVRAIVGLIILVEIFLPINNYFFNDIRNYYILFFSMFITGFFITAGYPFIFTKVADKIQKLTDI